MKKWILAVLTTVLAQSAFAGPQCTEEPKDTWQNKEEFKQKLKDEGYKIKVFKETKGNCYEIYGWNKEGKKVEIYFHPISGDKVKERID